MQCPFDPSLIETGPLDPPADALEAEKIIN
jgi:hypothetical protein